MADFTFLCAKCNRRVPTSQVRVLPGGKHICFECAGYSPSAAVAGTRKAPAVMSEEPVEGKARTRYQCAKCKYEFWIKDGHAKKCPYCNGQNIEEKRGAAQKLIDMHVSFRDSE